jgi:hypothetical protein
MYEVFDIHQEQQVDLQAAMPIGTHASQLMVLNC